MAHAFKKSKRRKFPIDIEETIRQHNAWLVDKRRGKRAEFEGLDLKGVSLEGLSMNHVSFIRCDFSGAYIQDVDFYKSNLAGSNFRRSDISGTRFNNCHLANVSFRSAQLAACSFIGSALTKATFTLASLEGVSFTDAILDGSHFTKSALLCCDFRGADLCGTTLVSALISECDFSGARSMPNAIDYLKENFEFTSEGMIAYKTFGDEFNPNLNWDIKEGAVISENVNWNRFNDCGCGINVAPYSWVSCHYSGKIWKILIRWEWLSGVVVPYDTNGKIRCERAEIVEVATPPVA